MFRCNRPGRLHLNDQHILNKNVRNVLPDPRCHLASYTLVGCCCLTFSPALRRR